MRTAALLVFLACAHPGAFGQDFTAASSTGAVRAAFFPGASPLLRFPLMDSVRRLLRENPQGYLLRRSDTVQSSYNGEGFQFRMPAGYLLSGAGLGAISTGTVEAIETSYGIFAILGSDPEFFDRFSQIVRDPSTYDPPTNVACRRLRAAYTSARLEGGDRFFDLQMESELSSPRRRNSVAFLFETARPGGISTAVFLPRRFGGEGRLAASLRLLRERYGPDLLALSFSGLCASCRDFAGSALRMEDAGLTASNLGGGEFRRLKDALAYSRGRPEGVALLAANVVYSTDPARGPFPPWRVFESGGKRVGVLGLSRESWQSEIPVEFERVLRLEDPVRSAQRHVPDLRAKADVVVALTDLRPQDNSRLLEKVRGIDVIIGNHQFLNPDNSLPSFSAEDEERDPFDPPLLTAQCWSGALGVLEIRHRPLPGGLYGFSVREEHQLLADTLPDATGYADLDTETLYGVSSVAAPPVLPSLRRIYPEVAGIPNLDSRSFWNLAASLLAEATRAEAAFVPIDPVRVVTVGDFSEPMVASWFQHEDRVVAFDVPGSALKRLLSRVRAQQELEQTGEFPAGELRASAGGFGEGGTIHGEAIDPSVIYRVAATERLAAQFAEFSNARAAEPLGPLRETVMGRLRAHALGGWGAGDYRRILDGAPVKEGALWRVFFRDVGVNLSDTNVTRDSAFDRVPNSRIQGFDEVQLGGVSKIDVDYLRGAFRWNNSLEMEYVRSRLTPPGQPSVVNIPKNRLDARTTGTLRVASFPWKWMAEGAGPSLGFQYEGELEKTAYLRRKNIFSLFPGAECFGGTWIKTLRLAGNVKRDLSRDSANNQFGLRAQVLMARQVRAGSLQGELWTNYFVRTARDSDQDLLWEGDAILKVSFPIYRQLALAPFVDFYYFSLKTRPLSGYSAMMGVSLGFSRLWKPQYEKF